MNKSTPLAFCLFLALFSCQNERPVSLKHGQKITTSLTIRQGTYQLNGADSLNQPALTIEGENITVDFSGSALVGSPETQLPNKFTGTGILIKGKNITLKNATVRGYKVALMAEGSDSLKLVDCDFSYNYRQHLKSTREREGFADWLSYHQDDKDEWLRYGAAVYLKNCDHVLVKNITVTGGQNGVMMTGCDGGLFYNNTIQFNSGVGIGLYRSSRNRVMHNRLDWNVRGYSHGFYQRGQDSAGILVYEQSSDNVFANNSATHSGDGFFLWAGQTTMDTGEGGCNNNLIVNNDFSYAPTNGVEVTFSSNKIIANKMEECRYGVWGGYSFESEIVGNIISGCDFGVAIEHGNNNIINNNYFKNIGTGIQLWERENQPKNWGFAEKRNVKSRDYIISENNFNGVEKPFNIEKTINADIENNPQDTIQFSASIPSNNLGELISQLNLDKNNFNIKSLSLPDGIDAALPEGQLKGRKYIIVDEWGPYDFRSPAIWLRNIEGNQYTFLLLGPPQGNYKITGGEGWAKLNRVSGAFPATLIAVKKDTSEWLTLDLEFIGEAFIDRFGNFNKKGKVFPFNFKRLEKKLEWQVRFYNYDETSDPVKNYEAFKKLKNNTPQKQEIKNGLYYAWWRSPGENINADKFATFAETDFKINPGKYKIFLTSDDGAKLFLDGKLLIDHWNIHEPATDEIEVELGGSHHLEIEHFEGGGFGTLDFRLTRI